MAQVRTAAATAIARPSVHGMVDDFAAMGQFRQLQSVVHLALLGLFDAHQGHPGGPGTGVKLQGDLLHLAPLSAAILASDRERPHSMHHRSLAREQQARSSL
jgi:hypothetical protein